MLPLRSRSNESAVLLCPSLKDVPAICRVPFNPAPEHALPAQGSIAYPCWVAGGGMILRGNLYRLAT